MSSAKKDSKLNSSGRLNGWATNWCHWKRNPLRKPMTQKVQESSSSRGSPLDWPVRSDLADGSCRSRLRPEFRIGSVVKGRANPANESSFLEIQITPGWRRLIAGVHLVAIPQWRQ